MIRKRLSARALLIFSFTAMLGLCFWNFILARHQVLTEHNRWAVRVSRRLTTERLSSTRWLQELHNLNRKDLQRALTANDEFVGAYYFDVQTNEFERWMTPAYDQVFVSPDPRIVVAQLKSVETNTTQLGPVLIVKGALFHAVAEPVDKRHILVSILHGSVIQHILSEEEHWTMLHAFVFDADGHPLYVGGDMNSISPSLEETLARAKSESKSGFMSLKDHFFWQWLATYHLAPGVDGVFILSEPLVWGYLPVIVFLISMLCVVWLASLPWQAEKVTLRAREAAELGQFAVRVDNFVRGKDLTLHEPPYPFHELTPIVQAVRWIMPQWKKAADYPKEFGLERKLLSLLIESLPEGILFFNAQGMLQLGNELGKVFFALQQETGKEYKMAGPIKVPLGFLEPFAEPVFTGQQKNLGKELEVGWADGKHLYRVWVEAVEVEDKAQGFIVVIRDITFRKQWEYVQEQVLSGITHDLRGPLSAIMGYTDLLKRQLKDGPPKAQEYLMLAREAGTRLTQMISDILDVVRFEQGKIEMVVQSISVDEIFERVKNIFGVTAGQKNVTLKLAVAQPGILVSGDPKLLERILDNLVGNAIKFTPTGGTITVSALREAERTSFSVADTGRGIPKEAQSRIFDKFQQVRPGDRSGGYGLGLAVVKFIVEAHKGEIRVESEVDKGSTFTFWIPDQPNTPVEQAEVA